MHQSINKLSSTLQDLIWKIIEIVITIFWKFSKLDVLNYDFRLYNFLITIIIYHRLCFRLLKIIISCFHSNGGYVTSPKIGRYCGNRIQPIIKSDSNILMVTFRSDDSLSAPGFEIFWDGTTIGKNGYLGHSKCLCRCLHYP